MNRHTKITVTFRAEEIALLLGVLERVLCHNVVVLFGAMYEHDLVPMLGAPKAKVA